MPEYEITTPSGQQYIVTAPQGASQDEVLAFAKKMTPVSARQPSPSQADGAASPYDAALAAARSTMQATAPGARGSAPAAPDDGGGVSQAALNLLAGGVRGAGSIGATILAPYDMISDAIAGKGLSLQANRQRRADMDAALQDFGAQPDSLAYGAGKLAAEVAGTAAVGGAVAKPVQALADLAQGTRAAPVLDALGNSIASSGFQTGSNMGRAADIATRVAGGAIAGGAGAGLVNPESAGTGAVIGGAVPPLVQVGSAAVDRVAALIRNARTPQEARLAQQIASKLGVTADDLAALRTGPQIIPGYEPTVPQIVQDPVASQLQRTLKTAGGDALGDAEKVQQQAIQDSLRGIAPVANTTQDAASVAGNAISDYAVPAERDARQNVSALFNAVPDSEATMQLPLQQMMDAQQKYVGPGTFGKGNDAVERALSTAQNVGFNPDTMQATTVPFSQIQALRSSIGEAITDAQSKGQNQAAAALTMMKNSIDNKIADVATGNAQPGEVFTPQAIDTWGQALAAHAQKQQQFATGPQASMFRMGADGQPAIQGAEIPGKFFNGNRSQEEDVQAFKRLVGNRQDLEQVLKGYALTEGLSTSNQGGNLTQKFLNWADLRSGAISQLFTKEEQLKITMAARAVEKQLTAENLGRVSGSDTAQKLASLQNNGLLDSKAVDFLAKRIPIVGGFTGPMVDSLRAAATKTKQDTMAQLLASPEKLEQALRAAPAAATSAGPSAIASTAAKVLPVAGAALIGGTAAAAQPDASRLAYIPMPQRQAMQQRASVGDIMNATSVDDAIAAAKSATGPSLQVPVSATIGNPAAQPATPTAVQQVDAPIRVVPGRNKPQPEAIWFGRRGDGYQAITDAQAALPSRQRADPDHVWYVEKMLNGRFRLAGYSEPQ